MKNLKIFTTLLIVVVFLAGCGLSKMVKKYGTVKYEVKPEVLQTHGGKISVSVTGTFPVKYFHSKASVEFTPELKYDGGSTELKTVKLQGDKVVGADGIVIKKVAGGSFTYTDVIDYKPVMNKSELVVNAKAILKSKTVELGEVKLADGVIYTSERVEKDGNLLMAEHGYEKETIISQNANLYFAYNKSNLEMTLALNKDKENATKIDTLKKFISKGWKIKSISINAWASPEGELTLNEKLSDERGKTAKDFIVAAFQKIIKGNKDKTIIIADPKKDIQFEVIAKGEDYDGFMKALAASNIEKKDAIENVIKSQGTKADREKQIKNMTVIFVQVEQMLSVLRRSEISINYYEPKKTDEEIANLSTSNPAALNLKEILYAGTLTQDMNIKLKIYKAAINGFPEDWKCYNNAGFASLKLGNVDEAQSLFEKANTLSANNGIVLNNLGVTAIYKTDYANAETYFNQAKQAGTDVDFNTGILFIKKGDYNGALGAFSTSKCKYNIALAQVLSDNAAAAVQTLQCAEQNASNFYLMAIIGARTNNTQMLYDNLKKAIQADASYRSQAKDDREFLKYFEAAEFKDAIK